MAATAETSRQTGNAPWTPTGPLSSEVHQLGMEVKVVAQGLKTEKFNRLVALGNRLMRLGKEVYDFENTARIAEEDSNTPDAATETI